jgi:hypothetical protein
MAEIGDINSNQQKLIDKTTKPGTDHNAKLWIVRCVRVKNGDMCDHVYGVNGTDFHERKCPNCQDGRTGLPLP